MPKNSLEWSPALISAIILTLSTIVGTVIFVHDSKTIALLNEQAIANLKERVIKLESQK